MTATLFVLPPLAPGRSLLPLTDVLPRVVAGRHQHLIVAGGHQLHLSIVPGVEVPDGRAGDGHPADNPSQAGQYDLAVVVAVLLVIVWILKLEMTSHPI